MQAVKTHTCRCPPTQIDPQVFLESGDDGGNLGEALARNLCCPCFCCDLVVMIGLVAIRMILQVAMHSICPAIIARQQIQVVVQRFIIAVSALRCLFHVEVRSANC